MTTRGAKKISTLPRALGLHDEESEKRNEYTSGSEIYFDCCLTQVFAFQMHCQCSKFDPRVALRSFQAVISGVYL